MSSVHEATARCRAWIVTRADGWRFGFTDHDGDLEVDGVLCAAASGLTASALHSSTGLSVDNLEALGVLSHDAIRAEDIREGRYDGAAVDLWAVDWRSGAVIDRLFRGEIGEIQVEGGAFTAELRGLSERLNEVKGRVFQKQCDAILGDARCGKDLNAPGYSLEIAVERVTEDRVFRFGGIEGFATRWFERGRFKVLTGAAAGLEERIKVDQVLGSERLVELWAPLPAAVAVGDMLRLEAGCDKLFDTCRKKFENGGKFRGFPHVPGDDWLMSYPSKRQVMDGGSRS